MLFAITAFSLSVNFWGNEFILFPKDDVRHHYIYYEAQEGTSIEQTDLLAKNLVDQITQTTESDQIEGLLTQSGMQSKRFFASGGKGESTGEMFLFLKENSKYRKNPEVLLKKLRNIDNKDFKTLQFEARGAGPSCGICCSYNLYFTRPS